MNSTKVALIVFCVISAMPLLACGGCLFVATIVSGVQEATKTPQQRANERLQETLRVENERMQTEAQKLRGDEQAKAEAARIAAESQALPRLNKERLAHMLKVVESDEVAKLWVTSVTVNDTKLVVYVSNAWLLRHEKIQLQDVQNFSKAWLAMIPQTKLDSASIEVRDVNDNKLAAYNSTWGAWVEK
jgi:hypothetical protein